MTAPARECQPEGEGYTEAQGYAASLRQMAQWMVDGNSHDVDEGELCMAANLIDRQAHRIEELTKALEEITLGNQALARGIACEALRAVATPLDDKGTAT